MANLTSDVFPSKETTPCFRYTCGSGRQFKTPDGHVSEQSMSCQWDKTWQPGSSLPGACDWVSCLQPPRPPDSTNLRVTHWDGQPVQFGDTVHFVCQRGFYFEEDPSQLEVTYSCQDGTVQDTSRGFFDNPDNEKEWPRCLKGIAKLKQNHTLRMFIRLALPQTS